MKIDFKVIGLVHQRPTEVRLSFVELYDTHIRYRVDFTADEFVDTMDQSLGHTSEITNLDSYVKKSAICAIEKTYVSESKVWLVWVVGDTTELKLFFKREEAAQGLLKDLLSWWLGI